MLHRIGNKQRIAKRIIPYFPEHEIYIEPFFGAGGLFFNKPKVKYNIVNDYSADVYNLYMVVKNHNAEFIEALQNIPYDNNLFQFWKANKEIEPIYKAIRFIMLSNFSMSGHSHMIQMMINNSKKIVIQQIPFVHYLLDDVIITSYDFEIFLKKLRFRSLTEKSRAFIYCDPPYYNTFNNYGIKWTEDDTVRLFLVLSKLNIKFAISESDSDLILFLANRFKLSIKDLGEFKSLTSKRKELLITNY